MIDSEQKKPPRRIRWKRLLLSPLIILAAIIVLVEDWLWDDLVRITGYIGRWPVIRQVERLITQLPPYGALSIFAAPTLLLIPVKLVALWFISHGSPLMGLVTAVLAKVLGTALVARLYSLTHEKLLRIAWFAWLHERYVAFKEKVYAAIKGSAIYRLVHARLRGVKLRVKAMFSGEGFFKRRWMAARRLLRRGE